MGRGKVDLDDFRRFHILPRLPQQGLGAFTTIFHFRIRHAYASLPGFFNVSRMQLHDACNTLFGLDAICQQ